ncbi:MAG: rhomboid family intramembrane serine protease [Halobacteriaceae archaeon]
MVSLALASTAGMLVAAVLAGLTVWRLARPRGAWGERLRSRLLLGVPWGTLLLSAFVLAFYLVVQGGLGNRYAPLHLPFTSWSYRYPLGMVTAPFAHQSYGHLTGNLLGTLALAPLAEYAFGHFPTERGESSFGSWRRNPYLRAFVGFPVAVSAVALATSLLHWGPIIGFSGAVFAFAGFALVRYPLVTVAAFVGQRALGLAFDALRNPVTTASGGIQYSEPSWAGIAVLGHFLGLLLGAIGGVLLFRRRGSLPSAGRLAVGAVLVATLGDMWAIWWYRGASEFVLYRGVGVAVLFVAAAMVALVSHASDRPLPVFEDVDRRTAAIALFVLPLVVVAFVAVPVNFATVPAESTPNPDGAVSVRGYDVTYAEDVPNPRIAGINVSVGETATDVRTGGVIVVNPDRSMWTQAAAPSELAARGYAVVRVGGVGWRREVVAARTGWNVAGNGSVYRVWLRPEGGAWSPSFASENRTARPVVAGRTVSVVTVPVTETPNATTGFALRVQTRNRTLGTAPIPTGNRTTRAGGVTFSRDGRRVVAFRNGTRVAVASRESRI